MRGVAIRAQVSADICFVKVPPVTTYHRSAKDVVHGVDPSSLLPPPPPKNVTSARHTGSKSAGGKARGEPKRSEVSDPRDKFASL